MQAILSVLCGPYKPNNGLRANDKRALVLLPVGCENSKTRAILSLLCGPYMPLYKPLQAQQRPLRE